MKRKISLLFMLALIPVLGIFLACDPKDEEEDDNPEKVFYNGKIYTLNGAQTWASAIYINDGIIEYVGTDEEAEEYASEDAEWIDLEGAFVMPGIHDVHMHPLEAASENFKFIVDENETDPENYANDVAQAIIENPGEGWLLGWGHLLETVLEAERDPKSIIDDVAPNRPVAIMEQTSHSIWCNSKALELLGFTANTPNPVGGIIMRNDADEPNGILIDNAGELLMQLALAPTAQGMENDYDGLVNFALPELAKNGITSICEARTFWKRNQQDTWKQIEADDELTVRVNLGLWAYPAENDATQIAKLKSLYSDNPNSLLKINQIKVYADGIIHNTTAAMHDDYLVDYFGEATNNGLNYFAPDRLAQYIAELEDVGFDFHIHALGNRGVHEALNAIATGGTANGRHRLTHVEYVDPEDYGRFAQLNVTADAQVVGDFTQPAHWHDNDYLVGAALANNIIPLKAFKQANARITLSSDWDVSDLNPFVGIQNAVTRSPQELSLEDALKAYTINAAYVMRQEDIVGSLEVGKEADFIVLDRNLFEIPTNQISQTKVDMTYLQGELVYER
ncbi:MAG: amidohydrolase [Chitinophagales bacterium]|nr:amidohydrolase [Chitinophagales bacterium]